MQVIISPNPELGEECWSLTGEHDQEYGSIERAENDGLTYFVVDWGVGNGHQAHFDTFEAAESFVKRHDAEIAEGDPIY